METRAQFKLVFRCDVAVDEKTASARSVEISHKLNQLKMDTKLTELLKAHGFTLVNVYTSDVLEVSKK